MPSNWREGHSGTVGGLEYGLWHGKMQKRLRDVAQQLRGLQCYCSQYTPGVSQLSASPVSGAFCSLQDLSGLGAGILSGLGESVWPPGNLSGLHGI